MIFQEEDVLYEIPIRFWEDKEPIKCVVKKEQESKNVDIINNTSSKDYIYVYSEEFGHNVYVNRKFLFYSKEKCKQAIELYIKLQDLYRTDEIEIIANRILDEYIDEKNEENL